MSSKISTHVLDTVIGKPGAGIPTQLAHQVNGQWQTIGRGETDGDGRCMTLVPPDFSLLRGVYRLSFDLRLYWQTQARPAFLPEIHVVFEPLDLTSHYHVPVLLSTFGFTTYRGS